MRSAGTHLGLREVGLSLAVCHPHADAAAGHALEHDGGRLFDDHGAEAGLEAAGLVVHEAGLCGAVRCSDMHSY